MTLPPPDPSAVARAEDSVRVRAWCRDLLALFRGFGADRDPVTAAMMERLAGMIDEGAPS